MNEHPHHQHALKITENFRREIGTALSEQIGDYHFGTLTVLIESAINTSVMNALQGVEQDVEGLLRSVRKRTRE